MLGAGRLELVPVNDIELDRTNPRIRRFLEMYSGEVTPEMLALALGVSGDEEGAGTGTTFEKLKQSILTNGGVIQPVILHRNSEDGLVCIEGNTRVFIYKSFLADGTKGKWDKIPALVHDSIDARDIDAIRLQAHLVGPRAWDPYSKAKYLHFLRNSQHLPFATIIDYCGGRKREVIEWLNAYEDMETYYRPVLPDEASFDAQKFSGFVELQKPGIKEAIANAGCTLVDFATWIRDKKLYPLNTVRALPRILRNPKAKETFLKRGAKQALPLLDSPDLSTTLMSADVGQLARALTEKIRTISWADHKRLRLDPTGDVQYLTEALDELKEFLSDEG